MKVRCDDIIVQFIIRAYDGDLPVGEMAVDPIKVFRGQKLDIWELADKAAEKLTAASNENSNA